MPFDTTVISVLDRIGLTPVPDEVLQAHKKQMLAWFDSVRHELPPQVQQHVRWFEWYTAATSIGKEMIAGYSQRPVPDVFSVIPKMVGQGTGVGDGGIPPAVINITAETEQRMREADIETERVVGVFYTDPYVCLAYRESGVIKRACLAIWDKQTVLHLAELSRSPYLE